MHPVINQNPATFSASPFIDWITPKDREKLPGACDAASAMALEDIFMLKKTAALEQSVVSHLIRDLRHLMGLTQEQFASALGVTYTTINR